MRARWTATMAAGAMLAAGAATAQADGPNLQDFGAYGIDREDGRLVLYRFEEDNSATFTLVGTLRDGGAALLGIEGSTHVPTHNGMFYAFWTDDDGQTHLVHVAPSRSDADELVSGKRAIEGGKVTGAASFFTADGQSTRTFILQRESVIPTYDIDGRININPNNADHMRFELRRISDAGEVLVEIDRWHLNDRDWRDANGEVDSDGNLVVFDDVAGDGAAHDYENHKTLIQVRPKGEDAQDQIEIVSDAGENFELHNANTYNLNGKLRVRIYNDHVNDEGMAMGKWWLELKGQAQFEQSEVGTVNRIAELKANGAEPEVIEAAVLDAGVLAEFSIDPANLVGLGGRLNDAGGIDLFVAESHNVYRVQPVESDTGSFDADNPVLAHVLTLNAERDLQALDFAGDHLVAVDGYSSERFLVLNLEAEGGENPVLLSTNKPGPDRLGTITFMPVDTAEAMLWTHYD